MESGIRSISNIKTVLMEALRDLNAESGSLMIVDDKNDELYIKVADSQLPNKELSKEIIKKTKIRMGESISGFVAKTKEPLLINDIKEILKEYPDMIKKTDSSRYKTSIVVPILNENKHTIAVLNINNKMDGKQFTTEDLHFAILLAEYCGSALILDKRNAELKTVNEIIREINQTNDLNTIFKMIVDRGKELVECKNVSVMIVEGDQLIVRESTDKNIIGQSRAIGIGVSGWVWKTGEPVLIKRMEDAGKNENGERFQVLNKPGSFIVAPLNLKYETPFALNVALKSNVTIGVLNFSDKMDSGSFNDEDLDIIINYANLTAIAIEKVKFYIETKKAYLSTVEALSAAIDAKDKSSYSHLKRVVKYSLQIADELKLDTREKEDLHFAALLHDVGKIGIAENILNKPGKLTDEEYLKMKRHVEEGVKILVNVSFLDNASLMVKHHHEKFDGKGYPDGLKGEGIPIGARILAVTDSYDAMISERVYKKSRSKEEAVGELKRCSGTQFDPKIVDIFLRILHAHENVSI